MALAISESFKIYIAETCFKLHSESPLEHTCSKKKIMAENEEGEGGCALPPPPPPI